MILSNLSHCWKNSCPMYNMWLYPVIPVEINFGLRSCFADSTVPRALMTSIATGYTDDHCASSLVCVYFCMDINMQEMWFICPIMATLVYKQEWRRMKPHRMISSFFRRNVHGYASIAVQYIRGYRGESTIVLTRALLARCSNNLCNDMYVVKWPDS